MPEFNFLIRPYREHIPMGLCEVAGDAFLKTIDALRFSSWIPYLCSNEAKAFAVVFSPNLEQKSYYYDYTYKDQMYFIQLIY
ncbi:hypothetical protein NGAV_gp06 [Hapavirus ngaingan]|uniref:Uncharacterized protein U4 n=1 Tax=Hapavirus ngaingan TaxID=1972623 RepID=D3GGL6_9RHAB|nr:hypothetical protein NGAV_gp06 [Hapavirus ngaingan]ACX83607.1 unknown [Hapavirus ngaingan]